MKTKLVKVNLDLLDDWLALNKALPWLREAQVAKLLEHEKTHKGRLTFTLRLHARLNRLRRERERRDLAAKAGRHVCYPPE